MACDVLFFGESVVEFGLACRLIQSQSGLRSDNLAMVGNLKRPNLRLWLVTPVHLRVQAGRDRLGMDGACDRFLLERTRGRVVVDARWLELAPEFFIDATHLPGWPGTSSR